MQWQKDETCSSVHNIQRIEGLSKVDQSSKGWYSAPAKKGPPGKMNVVGVSQNIE